MEKKVKIICDHCKGNGFLRINASSFTEVHQCPTCNSQGEVEAELNGATNNDGIVDDKIKIERLKNLLKDVEKERLQ
jgi:DnaJ-class molecular chaperone